MRFCSSAPVSSLPPDCECQVTSCLTFLSWCLTSYDGLQPICEPEPKETLPSLCHCVGHFVTEVRKTTNTIILKDIFITVIYSPMYFGSVYVHSHAHCSIHVGQRTSCKSQVSPYTLCILGIKLRSPSLVENSVTCWAISVALKTVLLIFAWEGQGRWLSE